MPHGKVRIGEETINITEKDESKKLRQEKFTTI
jgi:hypothetical protein